MTQDEIYEMVRESDLGFLLGDNWMMHHEFQFFAKLVAAKEREACAKLCETLWQSTAGGLATEYEAYGEDCAEVKHESN